MTGYVIKLTATATQDNPNFAGETKQYYHMKGGIIREVDMPVWKEDAYKSRRIAERVMRKEIEDYNYYKRTSDTIYRYWDNEYEVVEVETI